MTVAPRKARDLGLIDAVDAFARTPFEGRVWRVVREGRDPTLASPSLSRWCDGSFDILYTAQKRDGAIAEIHAFLSAQPVFPSKMRWYCHELEVSAYRAVRFADLATLHALGVETARYQERRYERTQGIAEAAHFLGFDGLIAPSARWSCLNLMLFAARLGPDDVRLVHSEKDPIDWTAWRAASSR
jgi:hypothetical protein